MPQPSFAQQGRAGFDPSNNVTVYDDPDDGYTRIIRQSDGEVFIPDAVLSLRFEPSDTISEHPGEGVQDVADNAEKRSTPVVMVCRVSNTALSTFPDQTEDRIAAAREWFEASRAEALTIVSSRVETLDDLVLESFAHDITDDDAVTFTVRMKSVVVATARVIKGFAAPAPNASVSPGMDTEQDDGVQPGTEADPNRRQSSLYKLTNT